MLPITAHSEVQTLALAELPGAHEAKEGGAATFWLSDDGQGELLMGWGDTRAESEYMAQQECAEHDIVDGSLRSFDIV